MIFTCLYPQHESGEDMRSFLSSDGEAIILKQSLDIDVLAAFAAHGIDYAKGPPSCTAAHQSADRQSVFKDAKRELRKQIAVEKNISNELLTDRLTMAFNALQTKFEITVSAASRNKLIFGLQNKAMTPDKVRRGYTICGQHLVRPAKCAALSRYPNFQDSTVDFDAVMQECYTDISPAERESMIVGIPAMVDAIRRGLVVDDAFMDLLNIKKLPAELHVDRSGNVIWQQHAQMITCADTQRRFRDYLWEKTPEGIAARQHAAAAAKALAKVEKDRQKIVDAAAKRVQRTVEQVAERARRDALSPTSKRDELNAKRLQTAESKAQRATANANRLLDCQAIVDAENLRVGVYSRFDVFVPPTQVEISIDEEGEEMSDSS